MREATAMVCSLQIYVIRLSRGTINCSAVISRNDIRLYCYIDVVIYCYFNSYIEILLRCYTVIQLYSYTVVLVYWCIVNYSANLQLYNYTINYYIVILFFG